MMKYFRTRLFLLLSVSLSLMQNAHAVLTIEITEGVQGASPIAIVPFAWQGKKPAPQNIAGIIGADLQRSGLFAPLAKQDLISQPHDAKDVNFTDWRVLNVDHLVVGKVEALGNNEFQIQFQLMDVHKGSQIAGYSIRSRLPGLRRTAHKISDIIYKSLTGTPGAFDTLIAYITVNKYPSGKRKYRLAVADSDGYGEQIVLESRQPLLSPSWSPDGKRLALTLSKDGNAEIYTLDLASKRLSRITRNYAIDTEPSWMPDGSGLVFTSDRGGNPQIYKLDIGRDGRAQGRAERLTFDGNYNARASVSANGENVALIHRIDGKYRVAVLNLKNRQLNILTDSRLDESPSFSANGRMIIYATI